MPRDTAGNYNLPAGNPVASGEIISASWANSTMGDLGQTLSASLDRYGRGGMLAPFQFTDGTEAAPGATWANEPTTGFYRAAYGDLRLTLTNADVQRWTNGNSYLWRNNQWEEILTSSGGSGGTTINNLVVTGSFTSPGIEDTATSIKLTINDTNVELDSDVNVTGALTVSSLVYPVADGTDGQAILTDGNGTLAFGDVVGGIDYTTETSNYTLEANQGVIADTTGGTFVVTLPLTPAEGDQVVVADGGDWSTTNLTVGRNGQTIEGVASDLTMDVGGISVTMVFDGTTWQLYPATGTSAGTTYTLDQTTTAGNITTNDITVGGLTAGDTTVGNLTSTGIDDNATSTAITIDASQNVGIRTTPSAWRSSESALQLPDGVVYSGNVGTGSVALGQNYYIPSSGGSSYQKTGVASDYYQYQGGHFWRTATSGTAGSAVSWSEAMRIDSLGNLLVGTTSLVVDTSNFGTRISSGSGAVLRSYRDAGSGSSCVAFGGNAGEVIIRGDGALQNTTNSYGGLSDARLKSNIVSASSQLDDIMSVQIRSYTLKSTGDTHIGVVAQELEAAGMSGLVSEDEEGMKSVKYSILYLKAVKALQEAVTRIETLEAEVAALKGVN
jgi:hypothetical protein